MYTEVFVITSLNVIWFFNPLTPMSDQNRISHYKYQYNIDQISDESEEKYQFGDN